MTKEFVVTRHVTKTFVQRVLVEAEGADRAVEIAQSDVVDQVHIFDEDGLEIQLGETIRVETTQEAYESILKSIRTEYHIQKESRNFTYWGRFFGNVQHAAIHYRQALHIPK